MNMSEITRSVNERAPALPKLLDYYVKNPDEFKAKFKNSRKDHRLLHLENSSMFFKFNECILFEHPYNVYKTRKRIDLKEDFTFGPWQQKMTLTLQFHHVPESEEKLFLEYHVGTDSNLSEQMKEFNAKINLSMANKEIFTEELRWDEFDFMFAKRADEIRDISLGDTISFETGRSLDVKKLWTTDSDYLVKFTFEIKLSNEFMFKKSFQEEIDWIPDGPIEESDGDPDFIEVTSDLPDAKVYEINKNILMRISPVFAAMLQNPQNKEVQENMFVFKSEDLHVVRNFCSLLNYHSFPYLFPFPPSFDTRRMLHLLVFADKYDIKSLYKICSRFIIKNLSDSNSLATLKVADMVNDEFVFEKAMECFLSNKKGYNFKDYNLQQCLLRHPELIVEMMESVEL